MTARPRFASACNPRIATRSSSEPKMLKIILKIDFSFWENQSKWYLKKLALTIPKSERRFVQDTIDVIHDYESQIQRSYFVLKIVVLKIMLIFLTNSSLSVLTNSKRSSTLITIIRSRTAAMFWVLWRKSKLKKIEHFYFEWAERNIYEKWIKVTKKEKNEHYYDFFFVNCG